MTKRSRSAAIAWAAGLFEGEGSIVLSKGRVRLQLKMTDEDVVRRFAAIVQAGRVSGPFQYDAPDGRSRKPAWVWSVSGRRAHDVALHLEPWLGMRRRERMGALGLFTQLTLDDLA